MPVYKQGGRDLMKIDSYRWIALTSMINQSAYRHAVSRQDAVFATQEVVSQTG